MGGPELAEIRCALGRHGHSVETPCGAKIFVRPEQYKGVLDTIQTMGLKPRHIIASLEFENLVTGVIDGVKRTSVKRRRIAKTQPVYSEEPAVAVDVKRTFIHLDILRVDLPHAKTFPRGRARCAGRLFAQRCHIV